ncbi:MAG: 16S rRNA (uracil(1498)-N(3))-methyltransferase [Bacillota bacterium]|nr:16S rRNA (uracil(1498)-N(3))-methyltransferase [Bacillota bacterium]
MPRFFCAPEDRSGDWVTLPAAEARHALKVLRLGRGDRIAVLDGSGTEYEAVIEQAGMAAGGEETLRARIVTARSRATEPSLDLILLQGLPKGDRMDLIVQKATELGVSRIIPVLTERSVARPAVGKGEAKAARWQRVAQEAAKQAGRAVVPRVEPPQSLGAALRSLPAGCALIVPWEGERRRTLAEAVRRLAGGPVAVLIGPEGGLSEAEQAQAAEAGGLAVTLGPRILRTETAGLVTLTCLLYATGNLE